MRYVSNLTLFLYRRAYYLELNCPYYYPDFEGMGISAIDETGSILAGRPYGGVDILITKRLRPVCEFQIYDDTRMIRLEVTHSKEKLCFINVYSPYQRTDNYDLYVEFR